MRTAPLLAGLMVMALALGLGILAAQPPLPKPVDAPPEVFSGARAMQIVAGLLGDGEPHPVGTEANARVAERIRQELTALGYTVETQEAWACTRFGAHCGYVTNLFSQLPGERDGPAVLLTAHYDSVPAGPGAADDMAGVAAILEIARILGDAPPLPHPVIFLFSDGEEPGLLGAEAFLEHPWADDIGVVVNLEANGTRGQSILFETTDNDAWLIDGYAERAPRPVAGSVYDALYTVLPHLTDLTVYEAAGYPGVNFAFTEQGALYHTPLDDVAHLDPGSVQHHGDNALAAVRAFAERELRDPLPGSAVFIDVAPGVLVRWPEPLTVWLAAAGALLWAGACATLIRRGSVRWREVLWGALALPLGLAVAAISGLALTAVVIRLSGDTVPWYAHPLPMRVALWTGAVLVVTLVASVLARRAGVRGLALGVWFWWVLLSLVVAWLAPGISTLLLLPALLGVAALAIASAGPWHTSPRAWQAALLLGLFGASWFWLPMTLAAESMGLGIELGPAVAVGVALAASGLMPFAPPFQGGRPAGLAIGGGALLMVAAAGAVVLLLTYSAARPQRLNVLHVEDRLMGVTYWALQGEILAADGGASVPAELMAAGNFDDAPIPFLPWSDERLLIAPAPSVDVPAPTVEILGDEVADDMQLVTLRLRSARQGERLSLYVPERGDLQRIEVEGVERPVDQLPVEKGYQAFHCFGTPCDGLELTLHLAGHGSLSLLVVDARSGLPPAGEAIVQARPESAQPSQYGDHSLVIEWIELDAA